MMPDQSTEQSRRICGAKTRNGGQCQKRPVIGRTRCRNHGGATPVGPESANYRHGRTSKWAAVLQGTLLARLEQAEQSADLLSLRSDVALLDARMAELLAQLPGGASPDSWTAAAKRFGDLRDAINAKDGEGMASALTDIESILKSGARQARIWDELGRVLERKRRLIESERKADAAADGVIPAAAALLVMLRFRDKVVALLADAQARGLTPDQTIRRIDAEYALVAHQPNRLATDPDGR